MTFDSDPPLTRQQLAIMYVIRALNEMAAQGICEIKGEEPFKLSDEGAELLGDFEPTDEEIISVIAGFEEAGYIQNPTIH